MALARTLAPGDTGADVLDLSRAMLFLGQWLPGIDLIDLPAPTADYTPGLAAAVRSAQALFGLPVTGTVTPADWQVFYRAAAGLFAASPDTGTPRPSGVWPGSTLASGSAGPAVTQVQRWLNAIAGAYCGQAFVAETGVLDAATKAALESYQISAGLDALGSPLGVVDNATWESLRAAAAEVTCPSCTLPDAAPEEE